MSAFPQRQVHLDFHTSPYIPDVGVEFDAATFAKTLKQAHVNSVTVFAKCHHGMCYYPTQTGASHPAIGERDLLGEQLEALHREGIRAPIYTTIVWEEDVAQRFPQWRQMTKEGRFAGWTNHGPDGLPGHVGTWQFNNFLDPDYQDYFEAHLREIMARYGDAVDGFFFDILFFAENGGWSDVSRAFRAEHGLLEDTAANFAAFQGLAQGAFSEKFTRIVQGIKTDATVFYNCGNDGNMDSRVGPRQREAHMTHFEIESLPSGFWGYHHFPRMARMQSTWGKPWLGMTGRFQKMWGDFGGIKPAPALEFECFRAQALGGASSIGDQLPPRGILDPAAYELIGGVYRQWEEAESFYKGSELLPEGRIGIFSASSAGHDGGISEEGAVLLCEESKYDCALLDGQSDLTPYQLLILPDTTIVTLELAAKIQHFHEVGGAVMVSGAAGRSEAGDFLFDFMPLTFGEPEPKFPTYWRTREAFAPMMANSDRVLYEQGQRVSMDQVSKVEVWVDRVLPYFKRDAVRFSSHFQTPPIAEVDRHPAVIAGERWVYFADPIFCEYRNSGNQAVRDVWQSAMQRLIGTAPFGHGLPSNVTVYPLRKSDDLLLTLLHYIPVRKAQAIDVIDERATFAGESLQMPEQAKIVIDFAKKEALAKRPDGSFELPERKGRLLLSAPGYFAD